MEAPMFGPVEAVVIDLLDWIGPRARSYAEAIDAWRTSCPCLPDWEVGNARGDIKRKHLEGAGTFISLLPLSQVALVSHSGAVDRSPWPEGRSAGG
jgi:hypothetical protein